MAIQVKTGLALKEWAVLIDAMSRGQQAIALRKGGIREKAFLVQGHSFYLLPTFEHQAVELLKPEFRGGVARALAEQRDDTGLVVRARADLVDFWEIDDETRVRALERFHIYTDEFIQKRFNWRPKQPLTVMLLRAHRLQGTWQTGLPSGVGGCRSWLEIDASAAPEAGEAAISDRDFAELSTAMRTLLG
jgi:hypothetical protein